jgi:hypothetical protein
MSTDQGPAITTPAPPLPTAQAPTPVVRPGLVLRADLSSRPVRWKPLFRIPFGPRPAQVGLLDDTDRAPLPFFPDSFTVAPDGSFWLVDEMKRRLAHFSTDGTYLGQIGGIRQDRLHPQPQDLVAVGDALELLEQDHGHFLVSSLREFRGGQQVALDEIRDADGPVAVFRLVSDPSKLIGYIGGAAGDPASFGTGRHGYATLGSGPGPNVRYVDGVGVGGQTRIAVNPDPARIGDGHLISVMGPRKHTTVPIRVEVTANGDERSPALRAVVGMEVQAVLPGRIAAWVQLSPSRPDDARRYGGGAWLLEFSIDGSPIVWERLPVPGISSESQVRRFAAGPDGSLYYMQAGRAGMALYRVPQP